MISMQKISHTVEDKIQATEKQLEYGIKVTLEEYKDFTTVKSKQKVVFKSA